VLAAIADDVFRDSRVDTGDVCQELTRGGIDVDPNTVDARHHHVVKRSLQVILIDIMLILADADALWLDLD
jgi:hypothetical protein